MALAEYMHCKKLTTFVHVCWRSRIWLNEDSTEKLHGKCWSSSWLPHCSERPFDERRSSTCKRMEKRALQEKSDWRLPRSKVVWGWFSQGLLSSDLCMWAVGLSDWSHRSYSVLCFFHSFVNPVTPLFVSGWRMKIITFAKRCHIREISSKGRVLGFDIAAEFITGKPLEPVMKWPVSEALNAKLIGWFKSWWLNQSWVWVWLSLVD